MGFSFNLFGSNSHRQFNYKPRYYDVEAEERRRFFGEHPEVDELTDPSENQQEDKGAKKPAKPGSQIVGSFRPGNYQKEVSHNTKAQTIIGIVSLILIFVVLIYIARFYAFLIG